MPKKKIFDLYTFVAGAALETGKPFPLECNCGAVVTIMPPVGLVIYVGDLEIYELVPIDTGELFARLVTQISCPRFPTRILRKQIGARVMSITSDAVFIIREGDALKKVRAEKLTPGMVLASGEKVFR